MIRVKPRTNIRFVTNEGFIEEGGLAIGGKPHELPCTMHQHQPCHFCGEVIDHPKRQVVWGHRPKALSIAIEIQSAMVAVAGKKAVMCQDGGILKPGAIVAGSAMGHMVLYETPGNLPSAPLDGNRKVKSVSHRVVRLCGTRGEGVHAHLRAPVVCRCVVIQPADGGEIVPVGALTFRKDTAKKRRREVLADSG